MGESVWRIARIWLSAIGYWLSRLGYRAIDRAIGLLIDYRAIDWVIGLLMRTLSGSWHVVLRALAHRLNLPEHFSDRLVVPRQIDL